jgi:hypothetical protein
MWLFDRNKLCYICTPGDGKLKWRFVSDKTVRFYIAAVLQNRNAELSIVSNSLLDTFACTLQPYQNIENGYILHSYLRKNRRD